MFCVLIPILMRPGQPWFPFPHPQKLLRNATDWNYRHSRRNTIKSSMLRNRSIPNCTVIPELPYPDINEAIAWLCNAFGFTLRLCIANHRAQLNVGDGAVVLIEAGPDLLPRSSIMVRVENVDLHHSHALHVGVRILTQPADHPYGERQYSAVDFAGHRWKFSQSIADVDPALWGGTPGLL